MTMNKKPFGINETVLCQSLGGVAQQAFGKTLSRNPLYDIIWTEMEKKSVWSPALSLIPVSRKTRFNFNVHVLQQLFFGSSNEPVFVYYEGVTPRDDIVVICGMELGTILDFPIPQGLSVLGGTDKISPLSSYSEPLKGDTDPGYSLFSRELENKWKSTLFGAFRQLAFTSTYYAQTKGYRASYHVYMALIPRGNHTLALVTTCACPVVGVKQKLRLESNKEVNYEVGVPETMKISNAITTLGHLSKRAQMVKCNNDVTSKFTEIESDLFLYLALETARREEAIEKERLTLDEVFIEPPNERCARILGLLPEKHDATIMNHQAPESSPKSEQNHLHERKSHL
jgi:hypothetical protein